MQKTIPENIANYTNITPDKLSSRTITVQENVIMRSFIKRYNKHNKKGIFIAALIGLFFPDSLTRIKNVNCTQAEYSIAKENDYILTFSFDGKTAYGCLLR